jgi:hypothetical protein
MSTTKKKAVKSAPKKNSKPKKAPVKRVLRAGPITLADGTKCTVKGAFGNHVVYVDCEGVRQRVPRAAFEALL